MLKKLTPAQQAWVDALRSGDYKQTTHALNDNKGYCCLGVACVVAEQQGIAVRRGSRGAIKGHTLVSQPAVAKWLGCLDFRHRLGQRNDTSGAYTCLTGLNDSGLPFAEIADVVEYNAQYLFD